MLDARPPGSSSDPAAIDGFEAELRHRVRSVQGSLVELYAAVEVDPATPQEVSRTLGINRNLAWKLSKLMAAEEPLGEIDHLPRAAAVDLVVQAFDRAGAEADAIAGFRDAMSAFDAVIDEHLGDRGLLELIVGPMLPSHLRVERDRAARRLSFLGNSATWGLQARVRFSAMVIGPSASDPEMLDAVTIGGLAGYRRLRAGIRWPLLRVQGASDGTTWMTTDREPMDPRIRGDAAPLLEDFCSGDQPGIVRREVPGGLQFEIGDGPVGNRGMTTSVFGLVTRRFAPRSAPEPDDTGAHLAFWTTPVEHAIADLVVHRDLGFGLPPRIEYQGRMSPTSNDPSGMSGLEPLDLAEPLQALGAGPPQFATPLLPNYRSIIDAALARMGWRAADFEAWRIVVPYPPCPSTATFRFGLASPAI